MKIHSNYFQNAFYWSYCKQLIHTYVLFFSFSFDLVFFFYHNSNQIKIHFYLNVSSKISFELVSLFNVHSNEMIHDFLSDSFDSSLQNAAQIPCIFIKLNASKYCFVILADIIKRKWLNIIFEHAFIILNSILHVHFESTVPGSNGCLVEIIVKNIIITKKKVKININ